MKGMVINNEGVYTDKSYSQNNPELVENVVKLSDRLMFLHYVLNTIIITKNLIR